VTGASLRLTSFDSNVLDKIAEIVYTKIDWLSDENNDPDGF